MNRFAINLAYAATVAAAALAATLTPGLALAESPTIETRPFVSTRARAQVQAEAPRGSAQQSAGAIEWAMQQDARMFTAGLSRAQVTAEYVAAREQVLALTSEDSGSSRLAQMPARASGTTFASLAQ